MEKAELDSVLPLYVQHVLKTLKVDKSNILTPSDNDFFVSGTRSVREVLFEKQDYFFRETALTGWSSLIEKYGHSDLTLMSSLRAHGVHRTNPDLSSLKWPEDLREDALAIFLLRHFLEPVSRGINDNVLLQFHEASVYVENLRSGKVKHQMHLTVFHQKARKRLSECVHELLSTENCADSEIDEKLLSAVIHSGYRSLLNTIGWIMYFLSVCSLEAQSLYKEENVDVLKQKCRLFIYETMRIFPSAWMLHRKVKRAVTIGDIHLAEQTDLYVPIICFHRSSIFFDDPYSFKPLRFLEKAIDPWSYLPFGRGGYACAGLHAGLSLAENFLFNMIQSKVRISTNRITVEADHTIPISLNPFHIFEFSPQ